MWVGIGLASLLHLLTKRYKSKKNLLAPILVMLMLVSPALPLVSNIGIKTRAKNWVAYDYAFNLLQSCEKNGILFTNGDNDTFPLWFAQEVAGIRRDVRVVNLSLLNTNWYIAQLFENEPKLNIPSVIFDEHFRPHLLPKDEFIKRITHRRNMLAQPKKVALSKWKLEIDIPENKKKSFFRVQDYMVLNIVHGNVGRRPIYFAVTVSDGNLMGLKPYIIMEGLVYRLMPEQQTKRMDIEKTLFNLDNVYRFTNLGNKDVYLSKNTEKLLSNYAASFIGYVYEDRANLARLRQQEKEIEKELKDLKEKKDEAAIAEKEQSLSVLQQESEAIFHNMRRQLTRCTSILPMDWRGRVLSAQIYAGDGKFDLATQTLKEGLSLDPEEYVYNSNLGFLLRDRAKYKEAEPYIEKIVNQLDPDFKKLKHRETLGAITALLDIYKKTNQTDKHRELLERWVQANPGDRRALKELEAYNKIK
jgi:Tfp pilus assembly protein PilF